VKFKKKLLATDKSKKIGSGQYGAIYSMTLNNQTVAIKVAKERTKACVKSIMSEIKVMAGLENHVNVLAFVGAYTKELRRGKTIFNSGTDSIFKCEI